MASIKSYSVAGVKPDEMGIGPAVAIPQALQKAGIITHISVHMVHGRLWLTLVLVFFLISRRLMTILFSEPPELKAYYAAVEASNYVMSS